MGKADYPSEHLMPTVDRAPPFPAETSSFIGRERELRDLAIALRDARLLTLTGAGGTGKTRVALQLGRLLAERHRGGVAFVSLATVSEAGSVAQAVAGALGIRGATKRSALTTIASVIGARPVVLILDNCEHVTGGCARLAEALLGGCPRLRVLATSRAPLRVPGEVTRRVAPFEPPGAGERLDAVARNDAVRLFVDRARARYADFALSQDNAFAVAAICRQIDGIPLAIELAAAHIAALSPETIATRLRDSNELLSRGSAATARHETLEATLDWSHALLSDQHRRAFRRLAVFAGSFSLESAEFVTDGGGPHDVTMILTDLVDKSLVEPLTDHGSETRYRLLEPIRQYARHKLVRAQEVEAMERRHARDVLRLTILAEPDLMSGRRTPWMRRLAADEDNIRAALDWSHGSRLPEDRAIGLAIAGNLAFFWSLRSQALEGLEWTETLLDGASAIDAETRAKALYGAAEMAFVAGRRDLARERIDECVVLFRELGDKRRLAFALQSLPMSSGHPNAQAAVRESSRLFGEIGDEWGAAMATGAVDIFALLNGGDRDGSQRRRLEDAAVRFRRLGDDWAAAQMLNILGDVARIENDDSTAERCYRESLELLRRAGIHGPEASLMQNLGSLRLRSGDHRQARRMFVGALEIFRDQGDRRGQADCLDGLAGVFDLMAQPVAAARLVGAADAMRLRGSGEVWPANAEQRERTVGRLRGQLGEPEFTVHHAEGLASPEPSVERQLDRGANHSGIPDGGLTPRESEVAVLVAGGLTNREIGRDLFIAEETARLHVKHILSKLGFTSRAQIAAWAVERGLASAPETI